MTQSPNNPFGDDFNDSSDIPEEANENKNSGEFAQMLEASFGKKQKKLSVGDKVKGEILVLGKEDVFVSTGTMHDGVVPRRDLLDAEGNVPYKVGDVLDLYVTHARGSEIYLSPKPTSKNLADDLEDAFDMMLPVEGRVAEVCKGGFRVSIKSKMAFCPVSQMDLKFVDKPEDYVGQRYTFRITQFSEGGRNIVVSRRKILEEEREQSSGLFFQEHKAGDIVQGKIARLEKFGAFVELAPGIDGLIHISELAWSRTNDPAEVVQVGQEVSVKILKVEGGGTEKIKISLSLKQAGPAPERPEGKGAEGGKSFAPKFAVGAIVSGKVDRREPYGIFVKLDDGMTGLLHKSKAIDKPEFPYDKLKVGDTVTVQIGEIREQDRKISLDVPKDPNADDWKSFVGTAASGGGLGTLGGAFGEKLKAAMSKGAEAPKKKK
jgi:small subunit ribosomal protein S1